MSRITFFTVPNVRGTRFQNTVSFLDEPIFWSDVFYMKILSDEKFYQKTIHHPCTTRERIKKEISFQVASSRNYEVKKKKFPKILLEKSIRGVPGTRKKLARSWSHILVPPPSTPPPAHLSWEPRKRDEDAGISKARRQLHLGGSTRKNGPYSADKNSGHSYAVVHSSRNNSATRNQRVSEYFDVSIFIALVSW